MSLMPLTGIFISEEGKSAMKVMMKGILIALALLPAPPAVAGETLGDMSTPCFNPYASKEDHRILRRSDCRNSENRDGPGLARRPRHACMRACVPAGLNYGQVNDAVIDRLNTFYGVPKGNEQDFGIAVMLAAKTLWPCAKGQ